MCLLALRRVGEADAIIREILASNPHYGLAKMLSGQIAVLLGKTAEAKTIFSELQEAEAEMPTLHNQLGSICLQQERREEAADFFRRALEADPALPEAHDGLGVALRRLGDFEEAVNEHMRAVSLQHDRPQSHINLGISLVRVRQIDWAIRAFTVATELALTNLILIAVWREFTGKSARITKKRAITCFVRASCEESWAWSRPHFATGPNYSARLSSPNEPQAEAFEYSAEPTCRTPTSRVAKSFAPNSRARLEKNQSSETPTALKYPGMLGSGTNLVFKSEPDIFHPGLAQID